MGHVSPPMGHIREGNREEGQIGSSIDPDGSDADSREEIEESLKKATARSRVRREARKAAGAVDPSICLSVDPSD